MVRQWVRAVVVAQPFGRGVGAMLMVSRMMLPSCIPLDILGRTMSWRHSASCPCLHSSNMRTMRLLSTVINRWAAGHAIFQPIHSVQFKQNIKLVWVCCRACLLMVLLCLMLGILGNTRVVDRTEAEAVVGDVAEAAAVRSHSGGGRPC